MPTRLHAGFATLLLAISLATPLSGTAVAQRSDGGRNFVDPGRPYDPARDGGAQPARRGGYDSGYDALRNNSGGGRAYDGGSYGQAGGMAGDGRASDYDRQWSSQPGYQAPSYQPPAYQPPQYPSGGQQQPSYPQPGYREAEPERGGYDQGGYQRSDSYQPPAPAGPGQAYAPPAPAGPGQAYAPPAAGYSDRDDEGDVRPAPARSAGEGYGDTYSDNEIVDAGHRFFGKTTTGLAKVIAHVFQRSGRPNAYIVGEEGGGALIAGLRYGEGTLYTKAGDQAKIYWQGPSIGYDFGANGSKTMILVYNLRTIDEIFDRFGGVDGSAYFVGGVGVTFQKGGRIVLAPITTGVGLRFGANVGYLKYSRTPTWNPF